MRGGIVSQMGMRQIISTFSRIKQNLYALPENPIGMHDRRPNFADGLLRTSLLISVPLP